MKDVLFAFAVLLVAGALACQRPAKGRSEADAERDPVTDLVREGMESDQEGDYALAVKLYTRALSHSPGADRIHHARALSYLKWKKFDQAIEDASAAIRLSPDNARHHGLRAAIRFAMNDYPGTVSDMTNAIRLGTDLPPDILAEFHYTRGLARETLGKTKWAEADYQAARKYDPDGRQDHRNR